ncbi:zinc finger and BTB domain-containing protein 17-like [Schistocerca piceifrons]|uniref:zinc finger and BTB domain-containing protein 17-like n=1 Tax=Schistocerca piceifrons TaxID=274613 RepID=UPI001F5E730A|nr:zinc finger and BTB domain-containing protein 17-like [Schistocerca piceifrons]
MAIGTEAAAGYGAEHSRLNVDGDGVRDASLPEKELHQCPKCKKAFAHGQILQLHIRVHEGDGQKTEDCTRVVTTVHEPGQSSSSAAVSHPIQQQQQQQQQLGLPQKKPVGLTKIRLEDCLRCDACSCIYIDKSDYNKHMRNFHQKVTSKKQKIKKECKSCCRHCNCKGNHKHHSVEKERGNNNLFHYNIKDRWSKMVSQRINIKEVKQKIKQEPHCEPEAMDYSHLLSQVEVKIKTEPSEEDYNMSNGILS